MKTKVMVEKDIVYPEYYCDDQASTPYFSADHKHAAANLSHTIQGDSAAPGICRGKVLLINNPKDALKISNLADYILVTKNTDPAWVFIMSQCKGLISEKGSLLSHTAIMGRELNIPTLVGVKKATSMLQMDQLIELNANEGTITLLT